uniref:Tensin 3 n=1 Tax=Oryzias sinensis TaxID=183150 RepID=A0A8C7YLH4_9TELE
MEEGYELDLTYITERIIAVSFPRGCSDETYSHNLKDVTRMLKSKHADNYLTINLSERRQDLSKMNPKTLDTGWPDMHAPPLDKICTICKAMESWLNADPLHVVVIHCRGGKGRIGVVISSFVHFTDVSASADQALDRFAMRKYYDDKVSALMTPSQKRYVWILNSLLSGSMKINASPSFLHCVILHGIPNFDATRACHPYIKVYQGMQAVYSSGVYHIGPGHRDRVCIALEPAQLLKGDIMIKCYHKSDVTSEREVVFRLQFHTGAVQGYNLMFEKEDMEVANKDPRFPDYGKVELVFSEGPEKIPGADRWRNGPDVVVDYNTTDPLTRWDSYQNICDGEGKARTKLHHNSVKASVFNLKKSIATLGRGASTTSTTSSPDHSDHTLSVSSDSGLSSTSLWTERPAPLNSNTAAVKTNQGPSQQEKVQLKRLLSGFGLEDLSLEEMDDQVPNGGIQQVVSTKSQLSGDSRPRDRETDILDDEVITGNDLHSVDSLGTLSSSCHKSSQNSLLSDGFGSPAGEEHQSQNHRHNAAPPSVEDYERSYADAKRCFLTSRSNSVASSNPSADASKQHVYRQGSYSTQSWVRQQQMVAAQQFIYMAEDQSNTETYPGGKPRSAAGLLTEPQQPVTSAAASTIRNMVPPKDQAMINNNNNNKRDEEFKSLKIDIENSIDQLNQLIMDLDPSFVPVSGESQKRNNVTHVNGFQGSSGLLTLCPTLPGKFSREVCTLRHFLLQECAVVMLTCPFFLQQQQHSVLYRSDTVEYRDHCPDIDNVVEVAQDMTPPTPAFPISPPTPYGKFSVVMLVSLFLSSLKVFPRTRMGFYALNRGPAQTFEEQDDSVQCNGTNCPSMAVNRDPLTSIDAQNWSQTPQMQPPLLPEKKRASDGEHSLGTASPALSGFSSPHSGSSLSIPFPNILPDMSAQPLHTASPLKQVTVKFVQDTSKFWYKADISRDQAISVLKDREPGCFIVRDSHSFKGAYGLAMKVATPPPTIVQQGKKGGDLSNELVRHFLIECTQKGVRLKGCPNEPYFGSLTALVCQHSITPLALPCKLIIPDRDPLEDDVENPAHSVTNSAAELLKQGAACNVWYLSSVEMESLTGNQAVQKATTMTLNLNPPPTSTVVHFKVSSQGITLTDNQRKLFFRRHYSVNTVIFFLLISILTTVLCLFRIFGFVARKTGTSMDNICHLFAEHDPEQPASAIVNFVSKVMIGSQRSK